LPIILATGEAEIKRIAVQSQPRQILENTQHKKMGGRVSQMGECLPCKCEALSSNPNTIKKKI
jgi:hypothetical protein